VSQIKKNPHDKLPVVLKVVLTYQYSFVRFDYRDRHDYLIVLKCPQIKKEG
jgi:hypothetical protein